MIRKIALILMILAVCNASDDIVIGRDTTVEGPQPARGKRSPYGTPLITEQANTFFSLGIVKTFSYPPVTSDYAAVACEIGYSLCVGKIGLVCIDTSLAKQNLKEKNGGVKKPKKITFADDLHFLQEGVGDIEIGQCKVPENDGPGILWYTLYYSAEKFQNSGVRYTVVETNIRDEIQEEYYCLVVDDSEVKQEPKLFNCSNIRYDYIKHYSTGLDSNQQFNLEFFLPSFNKLTKKIEDSPNTNSVKLYCGGKLFIEDQLKKIQLIKGTQDVIGKNSKNNLMEKKLSEDKQLSKSELEEAVLQNKSSKKKDLPENKSGKKPFLHSELKNNVRTDNSSKKKSSLFSLFTVFKILLLIIVLGCIGTALYFYFHVEDGNMYYLDDENSNDEEENPNVEPMHDEETPENIQRKSVSNSL